MIPLIDGDIVAFRCAASCEKQGVVVEDLWVAQARARDLLLRIKQTVSNTDDHMIFLSGSENYRKKINPAYKENRTGLRRPEWLEPVKEWLLTEWGAVMGMQCEADDLLGIELTKDPENRIICTLDKDLRQVPGHHYSWEIQGNVKGKIWTKAEERLLISPMEGLFNFYWQMVMGDPTDNIFGFDGKGRTKVPKFLEDYYHEMQVMTSEKELFDFVRNLYNDDERFLMNGTCLWIQRKDEDNWQENVKHLMGESGQKEDSTLL